MNVAAFILYGVAVICFLLVAGGVKPRIDPLGLGLLCCALLWWLQVVIPHVNQ